MKNIILFFIFSILSKNVSSQLDTVRVVRTNYITTFDKQKKYPYVVEWWLTKEMVVCQTPLKRRDNFKPDPLIEHYSDLEKDYVKSGFDRGHMMPAADNLCETQKEQDECFYFSNISPQYHSLNAGDWKSLETLSREKSRQLDSIHIWCGNLGEIKKIGKVSVPKICWKVIYIKKTNEWLAYKFENTNMKPNGLQDNVTSVEEIEKLTKLKFK